MKLYHGNEPFVSYYRRNFGKFEGHWPPIINAMLALMSRLEAEVEGPPLNCGTSHTTVVLKRPDKDYEFLCWFTYGLTFVNGEGRVGDTPAYFIQDSDKMIHRAETVDDAIQIIVQLLQRSDAAPLTDEMEEGNLN